MQRATALRGPLPVLRLARLPGLRLAAALELRAGEMLALRIESHSRRAGLLAWLAGDVAAERGAADFLGHDLAALRHAPRPRRAPAIAFVPPDGGLFANLNAWENVWTPVTYHHPDAADELAWRVRRLLDALGVDARAVAARRPAELEPLERRLVAFARAVTLQPELVVIDSLFDDLEAGEAARAARVFALFPRFLPFRTLLALGATFPEAAGRAGLRIVSLEEI